MPKNRSLNDDPLLLWLGLAVLAVAYLMPNHYGPWTSFHSEFVAALALPFLVWGSVLVQPLAGVAQRDWSIPWVCVALLALAAVPWLQHWTGLVYFSGDATVVALYLGALALSVATGFNLSRSALGERWPRLLAISLVATSIVCVGLQLTQWLEVPGLDYLAADLPPGGRPFANLAQPNQLATLLGFGLGATLLLVDVRWLRRSVGALLCVFLLLGLALTQSRTALLFLPTLGLAWWMRRQDGGLPRWRWFVLLAAVFVLMWLAVPKVDHELHLWTANTLAERADVGVRSVFWAQLWDAATREPWFGYGWTQVSVAVAAVAADYPKTRPTAYSHNLGLDLLVWNGMVLGMMLNLALLAWLARRAYRVRSANQVFALVVIALLLTHSLLEYPFAYLYFLLPAGLLAGVLEAEVAPSRPVAGRRLVGWAAGAASFGALAVIWHDYRPIEDDYRLLRFELANIGSIRAELPAPPVLVLNQLAVQLAYMRTPPRRGQSAEELEQMRKVASRFLSNTVSTRYVVALAINNRSEEAEAEIARMKQTYSDKTYRRTLRALVEMADETYPELYALPTLQSVAAMTNPVAREIKEASQ